MPLPGPLPGELVAAWSFIVPVGSVILWGWFKEWLSGHHSRLAYPISSPGGLTNSESRPFHLVMKYWQEVNSAPPVLILPGEIIHPDRNVLNWNSFPSQPTRILEIGITVLNTNRTEVRVNCFQNAALRLLHRLLGDVWERWPETQKHSAWTHPNSTTNPPDSGPQRRRVFPRPVMESLSLTELLIINVSLDVLWAWLQNYTRNDPDVRFPIPATTIMLPPREGAEAQDERLGFIPYLPDCELFLHCVEKKDSPYGASPNTLCLGISGEYLIRTPTGARIDRRPDRPVIEFLILPLGPQRIRVEAACHHTAVVGYFRTLVIAMNVDCKGETSTHPGRRTTRPQSSEQKDSALTSEASERRTGMQPKEIRRRILELIAEHENTDASTYVDDADLAVSLSISITQVQRQMDILEQEGLLKTANTFGSQSALLSPSGWRALEVEDHEPAPAPATFSTNIRSGIVQLVQNTGPGAVINQQSEGVSGGDIAKMIASMVAEVINRQDIPDDVKNDYAIEAESLKRELQKSRVNPGRVREMLAFLGDAEGTLGLAGRVAPWFLALGPLVEQYLSR